MLTGWKTYLCAAVIGLAAAAKAMGWINEELFVTIAGVFGAGGLAALRSAVPPAK